MVNSSNKFKIYIDFDGTITTRDIGEHMFLEFGDAKECRDIIAEWLEGRLTSKEVWIGLCDTVKNFNEKEFEKFLEDFTIDPYFKDFISFCDSKDFDTVVLSDGLDYYIDKIINRENLNYLKVFCNKLVFDEKKNLTPLFPYTDEECDKCANCKRNHILDSSSEEDITIYIGDGWSDTCAAEYCDIIFAKRSLLKYCEQNGLPYYPFKSFRDVQQIIVQLNEKKRVKKRHRAILKRQEAYRRG
ncbi:MAG: MtnX-like HAD-IB family phosphatase [Melioribacteraceae bacterium]|nr:MtnX-like HAD-IB family phosphatase [Melioribacteraceae bacterium]